MPRRGRAVRRGPAPRRAPARRTARRTVHRKQRRRRRRRVMIGGAMVVGVGAMAYKLSKPDAEKVEQYSGVPVEEMTDEELEQAVDELNLRKEPLDADDQAYVAEQDEADEGDDSDYIDELERLGALKDQGVITQEEFDAKKAELLGL